MAATESTMLGLGTPAPAFELPDTTSGRTVSLDTFAGSKALLVMFLAPHCPYVKHLQQGIARMAKDYAGAGLGVVAIGSNDIEQYPEDAPEGLRQMAKDLGFEFPFCYDEDQEAAKAYKAACTPDFFLFDGRLSLVYRGEFDDSRRSNTIPVTGKHVRAAIDAVLAGKAVDPNQRPSIGCNIKWKPGNEPEYFR
jgi:thiol-disulfide isomerase/thioredoxin